MTWFIANPVAGTLSKQKKDQLHKYILDRGGVLKLTEYPNHATEIAAQAVKLGIAKVVAIGGDGTVNEIAKALVGSQVALGIVPLGSGNGLARHLQWPLNAQKAVDLCLGQTETHRIDAGLLNKQYFFCTAGIGFEAGVAHAFKNSETRGLTTYALKTLEALADVKPIALELEIDGKATSESIFSITFANAGQYGNNAWIAPQASLSNGQIDVCTLQPFSRLWFPYVMLRIFAKTIDGFAKYKMRRVSHCIVKGQRHWYVHLDGEAKEIQATEIKISCLAGALNVLKT
jgi:diacylglycerol kinase (ATP)